MRKPSKCVRCGPYSFVCISWAKNTTPRKVTCNNCKTTTGWLNGGRTLAIKHWDEIINKRLN